MPETIIFDELFALMQRELPVLQSATEFEEYFKWTERYYHTDLISAFLSCLGMAVITVAQWEQRQLGKSYRIADLNRSKLRGNFEERLRYGPTDPDLGYTERDKELVTEYFRINPPPAPPPKLAVVTSQTS